MDRPQERRWHIFDDTAAMESTLAIQLAGEAATAIGERGQFHLVLAGGSTPRALYRRLIGLDTDWHRWQIWFSDERCLPRGDSDRNDTMAGQCWLGQTAIPAGQIHSIPAELGPRAGAAQHCAELGKVDTFDVVLLGLGEDGHTASLFSGSAAPTLDDPPAMAVDNAPKPPSERITLSAGRLSRARHVWFMVSGAGKADALQRWQRNDDLPAGWIRPASGVDIYSDIPAASAE